MDTQEVETRVLSDDQLDAVSGGDKAQVVENQKQAEALRTFERVVQDLP